MSGWALSAAQRSCCVAGSSGSGKGGERAPRRCHSAPGVTPSSPSRATSSSSAHSASIPAAASGAGPARRKWGHRRDGNQGNAQTGQRRRGLARPALAAVPAELLRGSPAGGRRPCPRVSSGPGACRLGRAVRSAPALRYLREGAGRGGGLAERRCGRHEAKDGVSFCGAEVN